MADEAPPTSEETSTEKPATDGGPFRAEMVADASLTAAAAALVAGFTKLAEPYVVTTDVDLVTSFATARQVEAAIKEHLARVRAAGKDPKTEAGAPPPVSDGRNVQALETMTEVVTIVKELVGVLTPTITTTVSSPTSDDFDVVVAVTGALKAKGLAVISDTVRKPTTETPPLPDLGRLQVELEGLVAKRSKAESAVKGKSDDAKAELEKKIARYTAAIDPAAAFILELLKPAAAGQTSKLVSAIRRLSLDDANILVVQPATVQVQQTTVSHFGRTPDHVLDGSARIPYVLLSTAGTVEASGIASGSASFRAVVDAETATLVWARIEATQTTPSTKHPALPSWLKAAAAALAGVVLIAAFSLPLVVRDLGLAADTDEPLDHNFRAESLTAGSAWEIGILIAPLIAALLALAVWSGPRAFVVALLAGVVAGAAGAAQMAVEGWGLSHLIVWGAGAFLPALLLLIAAFFESRVGPPVGVIERLRNSIR